MCAVLLSVRVCVGYIDVLLDNSTRLKLVSQSELKSSSYLPEWEYMIYAERLRERKTACDGFFQKF